MESDSLRKGKARKGQKDHLKIKKKEKKRKKEWNLKIRVKAVLLSGKGKGKGTSLRVFFWPGNFPKPVYFNFPIRTSS